MIDVHAHVVPAALPFGAHGDGPWPHLDQATGEVRTGGQLFRTVAPEAWDLERRRGALHAAGIETQVLSPMPELFCYWADGPAGEAYCQAFNAWLTAVVTADPTFAAFGIVPLQDVDRATALLGDIRAAGLVGVEVGSNVNGVPLHDERFRPFLAEAADVGLTVFVHAFHPQGFDRFPDSAVANAVTFPNEIGGTASGLIAMGTLSELPQLRVLVSHGGGSLAMLLPRLDFMWTLGGPLRDRHAAPPSSSAAGLYVDTLVYSAPALALVAATLGRDALVSGTDMPFLPPPDRAVVAEALGLDVADAGRLLDANARRLVGREDADPVHR